MDAHIKKDFRTTELKKMTGSANLLAGAKRRDSHNVLHGVAVCGFEGLCVSLEMLRSSFWRSVPPSQFRETVDTFIPYNSVVKFFLLKRTAKRP
jgi:hypothetical protein